MRGDDCWVSRWNQGVTVQILFREHGGSDDDDDAAVPGDQWVASLLASLQLRAPNGCYGDLTRVCLRGLCEKSGVVFLAAGFEDSRREALYALDTEKMEARLLRGIPDDVGSACRLTSSSCASFFHGYEMDRVSYMMTAVGEIQHGKGKMNVDAEDIYDDLYII